MKRAVIYLRVSTAEQAKRDLEPEGLSIPAQRSDCHRKAESIDAIVVDEYVDRGESARSADRPALQTMLARIKEQRDVDYVIVHKVDRLARNREDDVMINVTLRQYGAKLVSVTENIDETPSGKLLHGIMSTIAEFYSQNLAAECLKGLEQKARNGGTPARAPIGYLNVRKMVEGRVDPLRTVEIDPERAPLIRFAFEAYAGGTYTLRGLRAELERRGLRTRPTPKRPAKPIGLQTLADLLQNPYYIGVVTFRGVEYSGRHAPLVEPDVFHRVQEVLRAHHLAGEKQRSHHHYLKGSVFCARCGSRLCLTKAKRTYLYFFCLGRHKGHGCSQPYVAADRVEAAVCRFYGTIQLEPDRVDHIRGALRTHLEKEGERAKTEVSRQRRRLATLRDERMKLLHAHYAGAVPLDLLRSEQERIGDEMDQAEQALAAHEVRYEEIAGTLEQALELAANCRRAYELAGPRIRRQFNQVFFEKLFVDGDEITGAHLGDPFAQLLAHDLAQRLQRETTNPDLVSAGRGSNYDAMVERTGIEPVTSGLQS